MNGFLFAGALVWTAVRLLLFWRNRNMAPAVSAGNGVLLLITALLWGRLFGPPVPLVPSAIVAAVLGVLSAAVLASRWDG